MPFSSFDGFVSSFNTAGSPVPATMPWDAPGPGTRASTSIDPNSNAITTQYNHQRKVVRAGTAGGTACDATHSGGCWYAVFYDQFSEATATSTPAGPTVQNGLATLAAGDAMANVTITSVVTSKSFLVFSTRFNDANPGMSQVSGRILDSTTLRFQRVVSTGTPAITTEWYVAEFPSGVSVQRGTAPDPGTTVSVPISTVDVTRSFPIVSYRVAGTGYGANDFPRAKITTSTNLGLFLQTAAIDPTSAIEWQVVEYTYASVQTGDISFATTDGSRTASITSVDPARAWVLFTYDTADGTVANIGQKMVRGLVTNPTTLTFARDGTGQAMTLTWYLVEFTDDTRVQSASAAFGTGTTQVDITITAWPRRGRSRPPEPSAIAGARPRTTRTTTPGSGRRRSNSPPQRTCA
jgi:hypothetical protein